MKAGATGQESGPTRATGRPTAGDLLIHPLSLLSLALLVLNDHALKSAWPGPVTGKLSDFAGVVFFPLLLISAWESLLAVVGRWRGPSISAAAIAVISATAAFSAVKALPAAAEIAGQTLGVAQWLVGLPLVLLASDPVPPVAIARVIADPTDLAAVPAAALALWIAAIRVRRTRSASLVRNALRAAS